MSATAIARRTGTDVRDVADEELLAWVGSGDRAAWGELYRRHRGTVTGYLARRTRSRDELDDLVHDAFLTAWDSADQYRPDDPRPVGAWLCGRAGQALREHMWSRHRDTLAVEVATDTARRPLDITPEQRETVPLSEPVRAAVEHLSPAQRQAVSLRYLHGLSEAQAAEAGQTSPRAIRSSAEQGRRKLAEQLAHLAPTPRSPLAELPRRQAARIALDATGGHVAQAEAWLRQRGIHISTKTVYDARNHPDGRDAARPDQQRPPAPAYTMPEHIAALDPTERAHAAGRDWHTHDGQLPSISQLAAATGVAHATAARALRGLKTDPHALPHTAANAVDASAAARPAPTAHAVADQEHPRTAAPGPSTTSEPGDRHRPRGARFGDELSRAQTRSGPPAVDTYASTHPTEPRHRVPNPVRSGGRDRVTAPDPTVITTDKTDATDRRPPADVSIAHARAAVAVLVAHRAVREQRRAADHDRAEQTARWRGADRHHSDSRSDAEGMCR